PRERRPELVRDLGREPALPAETGCEAVEQAVEGRGELGQLVVRGAQRESLVEVVLAPGGRLPGHATHRAQRGRQQPAGGERDEQEDDTAEDERRNERRVPRLLVRDERDP